MKIVHNGRNPEAPRQVVSLMSACEALKQCHVLQDRSSDNTPLLRSRWSSLGRHRHTQCIRSLQEPHRRRRKARKLGQHTAEGTAK